MIIIKQIKTLYVFLSLSICLSLIAEGKMQESSYLPALTLESALTRALEYNRQLFNTGDMVTQAQYAIELAWSEFDLRIFPNSRVGYIGGGSEGTGISYGGGIDFNKKMVNGTQISFVPTIFKTKHHYHYEYHVS
jgi:hypothetical protein